MEYLSFLEARNSALPSTLAADASPADVMASGKDAIVFGKASAALCAALVRDAIRQSVANNGDVLQDVAAAFQSAHFQHGQKAVASSFITAVLGAGLLAQSGKAEKKLVSDRSDYESALVQLFRVHKLIYDGRSKSFRFEPRDKSESAASIAQRQLSSLAGIAGVGQWPDIVAGIKSVIAGFRDAGKVKPLLEKIAALEAANVKLSKSLKSTTTTAPATAPAKRTSA